MNFRNAELINPRRWLTNLLHLPHLGRAAIAVVSLLAFGFSFAQQAYPTADEAADAFAKALQQGDKKAMNALLGADWKKFIPTQDLDREDIDAFLAAWESSHRIESDGAEEAHLAVGDSGWTLPIPIVKSSAGWKFDTRAGADEMRTRRIGRNELAVIQVALAYCDAQNDYARSDRMGDGVLQYAQKFSSAPGKHDGLFWPVAEGEEPSPLGPLVATFKPGESYHGYRYKILKAQGKNAPDGAYSYLIKNRMTSGYALLAWPVKYGETGVMSFIVNHSGQVYEKDLGKNSSTVANGINAFDPDKSWHKVETP